MLLVLETGLKLGQAINNQVLKSVYLNMNVNQLHINLSKCAYMYFKPNIVLDPKLMILIVNSQLME